jgi:imidazolonepropionase-like amidohydrolase
VGSIEAGKHADIAVLDQADAGRLVLTAGDFRVRVR